MTEFYIFLVLVSDKLSLVNNTIYDKKSIKGLSF